MRIRRATEADARSMAVVTTRAYDVYEVLLGYLPPPATEDPLVWIAAGHAWVGERDSEVMAVLLALLHDDHLLVRSAVVDPDWQGEGHGRALLDHAESLAREHRLPELRLTTNVLMERNISLYRHCGFRVTGQRAHPVHGDHRLADMVKPL